MKIKINYVLAILAFIFVLIATLITFAFSIIAEDLILNGLIVLVLSIVGLIGIYFSAKEDHVKAIITYLIAGIGIVITNGLVYAFVGGILYVCAGICAYVERQKIQPINNMQYQNTNHTHQFGDNSNQTTNYQNYNNIPQTQSFNKKLLLIPIVAVLALLIILAAATYTPENQQNLDISNVSISSQGYSMYEVSCNLIPLKKFDYLELEVIFYDESGAQIGKSPLVWNINNPNQDQLIKVSGTALTSNSNNKPSRAELYFYDKAFRSDTTKAVHTQNITIQ